MYSTVGGPRTVSDWKVREVLKWHSERRTAEQMAAALGVTASTLLRSVNRSDAERRIGRTRKLSGARLEQAREWYRTRRTNRQKAAELGLSLSQLASIIGCQGRYKLAAPELHDEVLRRRRTLMHRLRRKGFF